MNRQGSAKYCQKDKEKFQNLSEEIKRERERDREREYGRERYKNLSKDEKQKLVEYRK